jgi:hypothetical protein
MSARGHDPNHSGCSVNAATPQANASRQIVKRSSVVYVSSLMAGLNAIHVPKKYPS